MSEPKTPSLPGMEGAGRSPADVVAAALAPWVDTLDAPSLQLELGRAATAEARLRAEYADAVEARKRAEDRGDRQAESVARAESRARSDAVRVATARTQALRAAVRARREARTVGAAYEPEEIPERFCDVEDFVAHFLAPVIERRMRGGLLWCKKWWKHPEAANRLWALWRAYEAFRAQGGTALSAWWVYHVDSHLAVLMAEWGPFHRCRKGHGEGLDPLPNEPAPEGWWSVVSMEVDAPVDPSDVAATDPALDGEARVR